MWCKNIGSAFFRFVTKHAYDRQTDRQMDRQTDRHHYESKDRASIASRGN